MRFTGSTVLFVAGGVVLATLLLLVAIVAFPGLVGGDDAYVVTSNSMEPTIESGDVIVTKATSPDDIETGDIVTFQGSTSTDRGYVTHRVVEIREENGERYVKTKGDANDDPDEGYVPADAVQGVQHRHVPYFGYLLVFARSSLGLATLVVLPGFVLVASGCRQLLREFGYTPVTGHVLDTVLGSEDSATVPDDPSDSAMDREAAEAGDDR